MKVIRSTKCSLKFASSKKKEQLSVVLAEYGKVVNLFINYFWSNPDAASKTCLLKPIVDIPETWSSARLRKVAAREAIDMVSAAKERWKEKAVMPTHRGNRMYVSCTIGDLIPSKNAHEFDAWLHLASIGDKIILDLPIRYHKHFNKYYLSGKRLNSYLITRDYVQFSFEIITAEKRIGTKAIGIDTGINALASLSNGKQYGLEVKEHIERVKRCKHGSNGQKQARRALKQYIDETVKAIFMEENPDLIVVEQLKNMGENSKVRRLLTKNIRRSIGIWNWKYWLKRLQEWTELNRVSFRSVSPYYTSQACPRCGHTDRMNRNGEMFACLNCGHTDNADNNAGVNILLRFIMGHYGAHYKQDNLSELGFVPNFS